MLTFIAVTLSLLVGGLSYACWNLLKKNEELEDAINLFYARTNATVKYMRFLDERQMFERDDEVGEVSMGGSPKAEVKSINEVADPQANDEVDEELPF